MGPSQICGCPFREPRVFEIAIYFTFERETGGIRNMISKNPTCNDLETSIRLMIIGSGCVPQIPRTHGFEDYVRTMPGGLATKNHH